MGPTPTRRAAAIISPTTGGAQGSSGQGLQVVTGCPAM